MTVPENNKTITVPIGQVVVDGERRPINEAKVAELMESIRSVGVLNPIVVVQGKNGFRVVAGLHRLEAMKRLGFANVQCTVLEFDEALRIELAEIDENIIRNNPSAAEHALLTVRRGEIIQELAKQSGTLSQAATSSNQALRRAGQRTGPDIASVRDQASKNRGEQGQDPTIEDAWGTSPECTQQGSRHQPRQRGRTRRTGQAPRGGTGRPRRSRSLR
jgi:ParB/RepB/Spo0J family partition protein